MSSLQITKLRGLITFHATPVGCNGLTDGAILPQIVIEAASHRIKFELRSQFHRLYLHLMAEVNAFNLQDGVSSDVIFLAVIPRLLTKSSLKERSQ